jgi:tol-pal system protein YbgF
MAAAVMIGALAVAGPAAAQNRTDMQIFADLRMLHEELQQMQLMMNALAEQLKATNARLDKQQTDQLKGFADQRVEIDALTNTLSRLSEKVSDNSVRVGQVGSELASIRGGIGILNTMLNQVLSLLQPPGTSPLLDPTAPQPSGSGAVPLPGSPTPPGGITPAPGATPQSPIAAYSQAQGLYMQGKYDLAVERFQLFVKDFPEDVKAPDAMHLMAESYYMMQRCKEVIDTSAQLIQKYPQSTRIPEAYYRQGLCYEALKQIPNARKAYETLIKLFPDSAAAIQAQPRLKAIGKE